ncbi:MAG: alpha/beta fold hydrolase, partial [Tepidiformaceae bacterium]
RGIVIADGPGIAGGGDEPGITIVRGVPEREGPPDPFALVELASDLRPPDYAATFVGFAATGSGLTRPVTVAAKARPDWLAAVLREPGVAEASVEDGLAFYASRWRRD